MLGRLPWFAFERRSRALRFLVFFDIGSTRYEPRTANPTDFARSAMPRAMSCEWPRPDSQLIEPERTVLQRRAMSCECSRVGSHLIEGGAFTTVGA